MDLSYVFGTLNVLLLAFICVQNCGCNMADETLGNEADALTAAGAIEDACELYARANQLDPNDSEWIGKLFVCYQRQQDQPLITEPEPCIIAEGANYLLPGAGEISVWGVCDSCTPPRVHYSLPLGKGIEEIHADRNMPLTDFCQIADLIPYELSTWRETYQTVESQADVRVPY